MGSPMPFGCVPIRQPRGGKAHAAPCQPSPMPFGCVPIRQGQCGRMAIDRNPLCLQCLSAVCLSGSFRSCVGNSADRVGVSNAFRLCAYPAEVTEFRHAGFVMCLQCLSAVCLSGRHHSRPDRPSRLHGSPMPFGCVPIRQRGWRGHLQESMRVSNAFRLCAYPAAGSAG